MFYTHISNNRKYYSVHGLLVPCVGPFCLTNIKLYFHVLSYLSIVLVQVVQTCPHERQGFIYPVIISAIVADVLTMQGAETSVAIVFT